MVLLKLRKTTTKGRKYGNSASKCGNIMAMSTISSIVGIYSILFKLGFYADIYAQLDKG
jgi:hypothetical protein